MAPGGIRLRAGALAALAASLALAACGTQRQSAPAASPSASRPVRKAVLTVAPSTGGPHTTFRFTARPPIAAGRRGGVELYYTLSATGPEPAAGCVDQRAAIVREARAGRPIVLRLGPHVAGGHWCAGGWLARLTELQGPTCGPAQMCPQFIRLVGVVGRATFRVDHGQA